MSWIIEAINPKLAYSLSHRDLFFHALVSTSYSGSVLRNWQAVLIDPHERKELLSRAVDALMSCIADSKEVVSSALAQQAAETYYAIASRLEDAANSIASSRDHSIRSKLLKGALRDYTFCYSASLHFRMSADLPSDWVSLLLSWAIDVARELASTLMATYNITKKPEVLEALGLPTDTKELTAVVKKALKEGALGELFLWRKTESVEFETWLKFWFQGENYFNSKCLTYLASLDPELNIKHTPLKKVGSSVKAKISFENLFVQGELATNFVDEPAHLVPGTVWRAGTAN